MMDDDNGNENDNLIPYTEAAARLGVNRHTLLERLDKEKYKGVYQRTAAHRKRIMHVFWPLPDDMVVLRGRGVGHQITVKEQLAIIAARQPVPTQGALPLDYDGVEAEPAAPPATELSGEIIERLDFLGTQLRLVIAQNRQIIQLLNEQESSVSEILTDETE